MPSRPPLPASERKFCLALLVLGALVMVWPFLWLGTAEPLEFYPDTAGWLLAQWRFLFQGKLPERSLDFFIAVLFAGILVGTPCLLLGCLLHLLGRGRWFPPATLWVCAMIYGLNPALYSVIGIKISFRSLADAFVRERAELCTLTGWLVQGVTISLLGFLAWRTRCWEEKTMREVAEAEE